MKYRLADAANPGSTGRWPVDAGGSPASARTPDIRTDTPQGPLSSRSSETRFGEPPKPTGQRPVLPRSTAARRPGLIALILATFWALNSCVAPDTRHRVVISIPEQRMALLDEGALMATYPVSTSKFAIGDWPGSRGTPLGELEIAKKIGGSAPLGAVFKDRRRTGEILLPDAPARDPIVTRILWLRGREPQNARAYGRYIYIHGTPEERNIGQPASYGCVRMRSRDVIQLYDVVGEGAAVTIVDAPLGNVVPALNPAGQVATGNPAARGTTTMSSP